MKKMMRFFPFVVFSFVVRAQEYMYPVGSFEQEGVTTMLVMYQKSPYHTELWQWDPETGDTQCALLSSYTPVGVAMLPNNSGFSFFDNGRLRVKLFSKRSSKAIDIFDPLYDIGPVQWETEQICYFHAREREHFNIYKLDTCDGSVTKVVSNETCDCFYPRIKEGHLWYIRRSTNESSVICRYHGEDTVVRSHKQPLAFLTPLNERSWLVVEHPKDIDIGNDKTFPCVCYELPGVVPYAFGSESSPMEKLFTFSIPLHYIVPSSEARLCESIYPLLPRVVGNVIYFVSQAATGEGLCLYEWEQEEILTSEIVEYNVVRIRAITQQCFAELFPPFPFGTKLAYGGVVHKNKWPDDENFITLVTASSALQNSYRTDMNSSFSEIERVCISGAFSAEPLEF